jgi:PAS domain S-box-containing protein
MSIPYRRNCAPSSEDSEPSGKAAQKIDALADSERRYRAVVEDMPAMVCRFRPDGTLTFVNSFFCAYFSRYKDEMIGNNFFDFFPDETAVTMRQHIEKLTARSPVAVSEERSMQSNGEEIWQEWIHRALFDDQNELYEYQSIGRDVTETKKAADERAQLERQMQQAQKVEAVGMLAGGIAHDFNTMLSTVVGHAEMALLYLAQDSPARQDIQKILDTFQQARKLVNLIEIIGLGNKLKRSPVPVQPIIRESLELLRPALPANIDVRQDLAEEPLTVICDPQRLQQVIVNLCSNAQYSMQAGGGVLQVELVRETILPQQHEELPPGRYVCLKIGDTGGGMDARTLDRIFDPYFTTKEKDVGTGLGLAVVRGIVKKYRGTIDVESIPGKGTSFVVRLPALEPQQSAPSESRRILYVEDEAALADSGEKMIASLGYQVDTYLRPSHALAIFREQYQRYDLAVVDAAMPEIDGETLIRELLKIRPDLPVILCVGFNEAIDEDAPRIGARALETKPLDRNSLESTIQRMLGEP